MNLEETKEKIIENLKEVYDPDLGIDVFNMGLIYDLKVGEGYADIVMTLTSAFCPSADDIIADVKNAAQTVEGVNLVSVDVTFEPQWGPDHLSEEAQMMMDWMFN
ncbi:metal-sulfur cluster assembly factor [bacterium]|nr:metal-sulfur cluster assembly factor [bacterium]